MAKQAPLNGAKQQHPKPTPEELDRAWFSAAYEGILAEAQTLPEIKLQKPGNPVSNLMLRLASLVIGSSNRDGVSSDQALQDFMKAYPYRKVGANRYGDTNPDKAFLYQWQRHLKRATPRQREEKIGHTSNGAGATVKPAEPTSAANSQPTNEPALSVKPELVIDVKNPKTRDYIKAFQWLDYTFKLNLLDDTIEVNGSPMTDGSAAIIRNQMRDQGLTSPTVIQDVWLQVAYENQYHPVKDYLNSLVWDGQDHILNLCSYMEETTGFGMVGLTRWLIGAVAKVMNHEQNFMLVIDGPQGIGKSHFTRWLCPMPKYFLEGAVNPDDKDFLVRLATTWVWEVGELQATTRKADKEALKEFISKEWVTVRKAYARFDIVKPAMASMIGTINEDGTGFLSDTTGNRRFVIIRLEKVDWQYQKDIDPAQLWAQAVALYKQGASGALDESEKQAQLEIQATYQTGNPVEELFWNYFTIDTGSQDIMTASEIINILELNGLKGNQNTNFKYLKAIMKAENVRLITPRTGKKRAKGYQGIVRLVEGK